jgi:hypothetical protein
MHEKNLQMKQTEYE